jgi:hypothetical protein
MLKMALILEIVPWITPLLWVTAFIGHGLVGCAEVDTVKFRPSWGTQLMAAVVMLPIGLAWPLPGWKVPPMNDEQARALPVAVSFSRRRAAPIGLAVGHPEAVAGVQGTACRILTELPGPDTDALKIGSRFSSTPQPVNAGTVAVPVSTPWIV